MIHVIALITAPPGRLGMVLEAFHVNAATVRGEEGCVEYTATVDARGLPRSDGQVGPDTFVAIEKWASLQALRAHSVSSHVKAFTSQVKSLGATVVIHVLEPVTAE